MEEKDTVKIEIPRDTAEWMLESLQEMKRMYADDDRVDWFDADDIAKDVSEVLYDYIVPEIEGWKARAMRLAVSHGLACTYLNQDALDLDEAGRVSHFELGGIRGADVLDVHPATDRFLAYMYDLVDDHFNYREPGDVRGESLLEVYSDNPEMGPEELFETAQREASKAQADAREPAGGPEHGRLEALEGPRGVLTGDDAAYPERLGKMGEWQPDKLYVLGDVSAARNLVAIVGPRDAATSDMEQAAEMARVVSSAGATVMTYASRGVNEAVIEAALEAGARCVVVMGAGADVAWPDSMAPALQRVVAQGGALVSPFEWGWQPSRYGFAHSHEVMSALCEAIVSVGGAKVPSGTFSILEQAHHNGAELLAVEPAQAPGRAGFRFGYEELVSMGAEECDAHVLHQAIDRLAQQGRLELAGRPPRSAPGSTAVPSEDMDRARNTPRLSIQRGRAGVKKHEQ